ncbi:hypothetical protein L1987_88759 [Smallanthus sonchifolius]|nr:hypothetical protein L1987_88759 [Smallanthus sonchifolius]
MLATAEYSGKTGRHFAESNALRGRFHLLSVSWNEVDPCQSHFTQRSALLFAFILVTYRSEDLMLSLNAYRTAILRYRPLSVVLACSLKLIWCCLVPSVCSDSDEGYYIPPTQLPCLVVQNGSLVGSSSSIQASRPLNLLNWAASSPSAGRLPSFPCLAGYLKPAFEPTKPSRTAIVLLALRLESLNYRLNLPIGGGAYLKVTYRHSSLFILLSFLYKTGRDRRLSCLCPLIDMPEVPKLSPLGLSFRKPVRSEGSTETEPSSLGDLSEQKERAKEGLIMNIGPAFLSPVAVDYSLTTIIENRSKSRKHSQEERKDFKKQIRYFQQENKKGRKKSGEKGKWNSSQREGTQGGTALRNRKRGQRKGHILIGQQPGIGYGKRSTCFLERTDLTPSMTAHQGNNGQSRQRQARMLLPTRTHPGESYTVRREPPLTLDREGMTMGSQTVRRRTQPLYTREQVERVEQHLAVERVLERLRVLHRLEWNRNLKQNSINWL